MNIPLTVSLHHSPLDARRDVVRVHRLVLETLGLNAWDPLELRGRRKTAALVALAPPDTPASVLLIDDLTCANAGVSDGDAVTVGRAEVQPAEAVSLTGLPPGAKVEPATLRRALLGKVLVAGDVAGFIPQDFSRPAGDDASLGALIGTLATTFGSSWQNVVATVSRTQPAGYVRVTMETEVEVEDEPGTVRASTRQGIEGPIAPPGELPAFAPQFRRMRELLDIAFNHPDVLDRLGGAHQIGILLTGPPGSGKRALVDAVAADVGARVSHLWARELASETMARAVGHLDGCFMQATATAPSVVVIEDVEAIAPREEPGPLLGRLIQLITEAVGSGRVSVVCTTAHPEATSPELRRGGVLDQEIEIGLPQTEDRLRMLEAQTRSLPLGPDVDLLEVAGRTPGFVAADLLGLCREAALRAAQRTVASGPEAPPFVGRADFAAALEVVKPSVLHGHEVELSDVSMDDVGDMEATKRALSESVIWPLRYPDTFERLGVDPPSGALLYGPPGCGKTFLVTAIVHEARASFLSVKGAELLSKWVGESERAVRELFGRARSSAPALVFFDEVDALAPIRGAIHDSGVTDRVVAGLLTELDGIEGRPGVFVIGATNRPDLVDPALLRPGRLEKLIYVPPPDAAARRAILAAVTRRMPVAEEVDLGSLAEQCEDYSAADLDALARAAALAAMREDIGAPLVTAPHFEAARAEVRPTLRPEQVAALERFAL